jgi:hypothetical protein
LIDRRRRLIGRRAAITLIFFSSPGLSSSFLVACFSAAGNGKNKTETERCGQRQKYKKIVFFYDLWCPWLKT